MGNLARIGLFAASAVVAAVVFRSCVSAPERPDRERIPFTPSRAASNEVVAGGDAQEGSVVNVPDDPKLNEQYNPKEKVARSEAEWQAKLTDEEYRILRQKGTERSFTGEYWDTKTKGIYCCRACGLALFESDTKFESGCGWPSFFAPLEGARLTETRDTTHGMIRTEITCSRCDGHMGHVFNDGPPPTGLRYCINSASIKLVPIEE